MSSLITVSSWDPRDSDTFKVYDKKLVKDGTTLLDDQILSESATKFDLEFALKNRFIDSYPMILITTPERSESDLPQHPITTRSSRESIQLLSIIQTDNKKLGLLRSTEIPTQDGDYELIESKFISIEDANTALSNFNSNLNPNPDCHLSAANIQSIISVLSQVRGVTNYRELIQSGEIADYISLKTRLDSMQITVGELQELKSLIESQTLDQSTTELSRFRTLTEYILKESTESDLEYINRVINDSINSQITPENRIIGHLNPVEYRIPPVNDYAYYISNFTLNLIKPIIPMESLIHLEVTFTLKEDGDKLHKLSKTVLVIPGIVSLGDKFKLHISEETMVLYPISNTTSGPNEYYISSCKLEYI